MATQSKKRELAKDIVSFANEVGGTLIYGVPEAHTDPRRAPTPERPYGIDPIPGLEQDLENIFVSVVTPLLPEYRILEVELSEYSGKVCYVVWTPESWIGPHMVEGYGDGRFYRRGQFRTVTMSERDVEERYRRRLSMRNAANEFIASEDALHFRRLYGRAQAKTTLMVTHLLLMPNRVVFNETRVKKWLEENTLWRSWVPSMYGVRTFVAHGEGERSDVELHRNGATVVWRYTSVDNINTAPLIAYRDELKELGAVLGITGGLYAVLGYMGSVAVTVDIQCPSSSALLLPQGSRAIPLEPSGTSIKIRLELGSSELIISPNAVLRRVADELFRAFGLWEADCFDAQNNLR